MLNIKSQLHRIILLFSSLMLLQTAQSQNIPDANFAAAIRQQCPTCIDASNNLTATAKTLSTLNISGKRIANLTGLGGFSNLGTLNCSNNLLTSLPNLPTTLVVLNCSRNQLTRLPTIYNMLNNLDCSFNQLIQMPLVTAVTGSIKCNNNKLTYLPVFNDYLRVLDCSNNQITRFNIVYPNLGFFNGPSIPRNLDTLRCHNNNLTYLPAMGSRMRELRIDTNKITCLPNLPTRLKVLTSSNTLATLPLCKVTAQPTISNPVSTQITEGKHNAQSELIFVLDGKTNKMMNNNGLENIRVYPNPANNEAFINLQEYEGQAVSITLSDVSGKTILQDRVENASSAPYRLDLKPLQSGLFFVKAQGQDGNIATHKLQVFK